MSRLKMQYKSWFDIISLLARLSLLNTVPFSSWRYSAGVFLEKTKKSMHICCWRIIIIGMIQLNVICFVLPVVT